MTLGEWPLVGAQSMFGSAVERFAGNEGYFAIYYIAHVCHCQNSVQYRDPAGRVMSLPDFVRSIGVRTRRQRPQQSQDRSGCRHK